MNFLTNLSIRKKLIYSFVLILLIGMSVIGLQGVWVAQQSLSQLGQDKLQLLNQQKATALTNYYRQLETQAHVLSHTPTVRQALQAFSGVFYAMDTATFEANQPDDYSFKRYYKNQVLPRMVGLQAHDLDLTGFAPVGRRARQLQASYMAANELPVEEKFLFNPLNDTSAYGQLHRQYHNYFRQIFEASQLADFYLIEPQQGNIVYSTAKRIDFATSLLNGPQRRSLLRQAFDRARRQNPPAKAFITDFALYDPALRAPNQFVAMPVFADSALVGVVAFATGLAPVANIMTENQNWAKHGLNKQTQSYILGMDGVLRTPLRENIEKDALFWQQVKKSPHVSFTKPYAPEANQSALYLTLNNQVYKQAIEKNLPGGQLVFNNYNNTKMQAVYHKFNRSGFDWIIISQGSYHEAQGALYKFSSQVLITSLLTLVIVIWLGLWLISKFIEPIKLLTKRLTALAKGASVPKLEVSGTDEVSESHRALNGLNQRLLQAANYASQISQSTLQHDLTPAGPDDQLALALNQLRNNLQKANQ